MVQNQMVPSGPVWSRPCRNSPNESRKGYRPGRKNFPWSMGIPPETGNQMKNLQKWRPLKNSNKQRQQQQQQQQQKQKQQKQNPTAIHFFIWVRCTWEIHVHREFQGMKRAAGKDVFWSRRFQMNLDHPGWKLVKNLPPVGTRWTWFPNICLFVATFRWLSPPTKAMFDLTWAPKMKIRSTKENRSGWANISISLSQQT